AARARLHGLATQHGLDGRGDRRRPAAACLAFLRVLPVSDLPAAATSQAAGAARGARLRRALIGRLALVAESAPVGRLRHDAFERFDPRVRNVRLGRPECRATVAYLLRGL